jgi:hypothetical protein
VGVSRDEPVGLRLRFWQRQGPTEPAAEDAALEAPPEPEPPTPEPPTPELPRAAPAAPPDELPPRVSLTLEEAKETIRAAKGDVIQVGFLAAAYKRHQEEDPKSGETAAARAQLCDLIEKRLRDLKLLSPEGDFELREGA